MLADASPTHTSEQNHTTLLQLFRPLMSIDCFPDVRSPCSTGSGILVSEILGILAPTVFGLLQY
jgi:hypothetical protein